jgi:alkylation response protein AidB-like acyl-CoA dehydrogenase
MDLTLTETQEMFKKVAADFVKAEVPSHLMTQWYRTKKTFRPEVYRKAGGLGWLGMLVPEQYGGAAASYTDCAVVFEELGHGPGSVFFRGSAGCANYLRRGLGRAKKIPAARRL